MEHQVVRVTPSLGRWNYPSRGWKNRLKKLRISPLKKTWQSPLERTLRKRQLGPAQTSRKREFPSVPGLLKQIQLPLVSISSALATPWEKGRPYLTLLVKEAPLTFTSEMGATKMMLLLVLVYLL
ncbi:hypothetical protein BJ166DRAFT_576696 [Pestalotiopsis sp. NC0098]|nr:hypothetical protein BJ166DRAFT_576696 [Pestalotiopsis sp. NC0098]